MTDKDMSQVRRMWGIVWVYSYQDMAEDDLDERSSRKVYWQSR